MNFKPAIQPEALSVGEACAFACIGRTTLYRLIGEGKIVARKLGKKTLILREDLAAFLADLPREAA